MLEGQKKSVRSEWAARSRESHPVWSCLAHTQLIQAACCLAVFLGQRQRQLQRQRRPVRHRADYQPLPVKLSFFQPIVRVLERISFWDMLFQSSQSIQKIVFIAAILCLFLSREFSNHVSPTAEGGRLDNGGAHHFLLLSRHLPTLLCVSPSCVF